MDLSCVYRNNLVKDYTINVFKENLPKIGGNSKKVFVLNILYLLL